MCVSLGNVDWNLGGSGGGVVSASVGCWREVGELDGVRTRRNGIVGIPAGEVEHVGIGVVAI